MSKYWILLWLFGIGRHKAGKSKSVTVLDLKSAAAGAFHFGQICTRLYQLQAAADYETHNGHDKAADNQPHDFCQDAAYLLDLLV